jgi:glucose-6-phosphate dehydrogenase assembly protein OpcA
MEEAVSAAAPRPREVLARVDEELRALWAAPSPPGELPRARARTANLVLVAGTVDLADAWRSIVDDVVQNVPARAIVVGLDADGPDSLEADVTAVCSPAGGGALAVCSERVALTARGALCANVASVVGSLCLADVPTTLVWIGRVHVDDPAFAPIAAESGRIVLDAAQGSLGSLANVVYWARARAHAERPGVADLAWTRLAPWQELCARMFDEPRARALASRVTRVAITQASQPGTPLGAEASLLLGWLATRLGWRPASMAGKLRLLRADGAPIAVSLRARPARDGAAQGPLLALDLEAAGPELAVHGSIVRGDDDNATWTLEVGPPSDGKLQAAGARAPDDVGGVGGRTDRGGGSRRLEQRVRLRESQTARLLERTLRRPVYDDALVESVAWIDELRGEELACV